ncbi:hypothetical protein ABZP36_021954 [Zizania latifolia]
MQTRFDSHENPKRCICSKLMGPGKSVCKMLKQISEAIYIGGNHFNEQYRFVYNCMLQISHMLLNTVVSIQHEQYTQVHLSSSNGHICHVLSCESQIPRVVVDSACNDSQQHTWIMC